jgi:DNA repair ATPase RecN
MNIYFDKSICDNNKEFYDNSLKCLNNDKKIESEMVEDIKKFVDNRFNGLHDRLSNINQIIGRDREDLDNSLRDFEFKLNNIEREINKIGEQLKSVINVVEKHSNQQNRTNERIDKFENDFNNIKILFKIYSNLILFYIVLHTIVDGAEKFFGFSLINFIRGLLH